MGFQLANVQYAIDDDPIHQAKSQLESAAWPGVAHQPNALNTLAVAPWLMGAIEVTCIHPWNIGQWAGKDRACDYWLSPEAAIEALCQQLTAFEQVIVILASGQNIKDFHQQLQAINQALPTAELLFCERHAKHLATLEADQLHVQRTDRKLSRVSETPRIQALNPFFKAHQSIEALSLAFASDKAPEQLAAEFKAKRVERYQQQLNYIAEIKNRQGNISAIAFCQSHSELSALKAPHPNHPLSTVLAYSGSAEALTKLREVLGL